MSLICPDETILKSSAAKVTAIYPGIDPGRLKRAIELVKSGSLRKLRAEDEWRITSSAASSDKSYLVNDELLTCECRDWWNFNSPQSPRYIAGTQHLCKHLISTLILNHAQAEVNRRAKAPEQTVPQIMQVLFGQSLKKSVIGAVSK